MTACAGLAGVDGTLWRMTLSVVVSKAKKSVKVPPTSTPIIQAIIQPAAGEKSPPRVRGGLDRSAKPGWLLQLGIGDLAAGVHLPDMDIERATRSFAPVAYISE